MSTLLAVGLHCPLMALKVTAGCERVVQVDIVVDDSFSLASAPVLRCV